MKKARTKTSEPQPVIYIGNGGFLPGIPARDLTAEDVATLGSSTDTLIASGLYALAPDLPPSTESE